MSDVNWDLELKNAYGMGVELGIMSDLTFEDFLHAVDVAEIERKGDEAREKKSGVDGYLRKRGATDEFMEKREAWINNYELRSIGYLLIEMAIEHGKGFEVDWKADEADIALEIKKIAPEWDGTDWKNKEISQGKVLVNYEIQGDSVGYLLIPAQMKEKYQNNQFIKFLSGGV